MIRHLGRMVGITLLVVHCMFYPFLPGRQDGSAVPLSTVAQLLGVAELLLVPVGLLWLAYELKQQALRRRELPRARRRYHFTMTSLIVASIVAMLACYSGKPDDGEKLVAPIKSFGTPLGDVLVRRPYAQMQALLDATQPKGRRYYWKSEYLPRIEPALCEKAIEHAARITSPHSAVVFFQIEGALNRLGEEHSPVGNRDARYVLNLAGSWEKPEDDSANIAWARDAWSDLRRFSTGGTYVNFLTEDESPERIAVALGKGLGRLAEVKATWDPKNVFRTNRNIRPA